MEDENLLQMLEFAVGEAVEVLAIKECFDPFAYALTHDNEVMNIQSDAKGDGRYESLWQNLKDSASKQEIKAIVLLQESDVPAHFNIEGKRSIRVHIEHSENIDEKIAGRFLYIPYTLSKDSSGLIDVHLFKPEPVAFVHEIFVS